ncbi:MAG: TlyA family RNA methyltransferase [Patescibacteria group bacterium]
MKKRIDQLLVEKGFAPTRAKAQGFIMAGQVLVVGHKVTKAGDMVAEDAHIEVIQRSPYVSRGAEKIAGATEVFKLDFAGTVIADVGSSTGGFTDYALQHGATKVYAIDVGTGQLEWKLRNDPRVVVMEKTHIKHVKDLPDAIDLWVVDVSFISLRKVLPEIVRIAHESTLSKVDAVVLFKPQFEAGKEIVDKTKGVIKDAAIHEQLLKEFRNWCTEHDFTVISETTSPIVGDKGNREFFFHIQHT